MILKARYGGLDKAGESTDFNPYFGTDVGICSIVKPQLSFNQSLDNLPFWSKLFGPKENIQAGAEVGKANGLTVLIDAETYDYTYHLRAGEGFKVTIYYIQGGPSMMFLSDKVEKILKGSLDSIPSPSTSVKIQIMGGKVCLRCKGKTLLGVVNKLLKTKSLLTSPINVLPY